MKRIILDIEDKEKAEILIELLGTMNFVKLVTVSNLAEGSPAKLEESLDFFSLAGLWAGREEVESIRQKAWARHNNDTL